MLLFNIDHVTSAKICSFKPFIVLGNVIVGTKDIELTTCSLHMNCRVVDELQGYVVRM